jgi:hypothetical protein
VWNVTLKLRRIPMKKKVTSVRRTVVKEVAPAVATMLQLVTQTEASARRRKSSVIKKITGLLKDLSPREVDTVLNVIVGFNKAKKLDSAK